MQGDTIYVAGTQDLDHLGTPQKVELTSLITQVIEKRSVESPVPEFVANGEDIYVKADEDKFLSVLEHLIQNAQEATADNGFVKVSVCRDNSDIIINIEDDGCGMTDDFIQNHLFKPFDTTKGNAGMGIGVYESRDIIRNMQGRIEVQSNINEGTTFSIHLPEPN